MHQLSHKTSSPVHYIDIFFQQPDVAGMLYGIRGRSLYRRSTVYV